MGISTSTGTLTTGQSRTFNLSPASAVTLTISPNVRVTITETPATVAALLEWTVEGRAAAVALAPATAVMIAR